MNLKTVWKFHNVRFGFGRVDKWTKRVWRKEKVIDVSNRCGVFGIDRFEPDRRNKVERRPTTTSRVRRTRLSNETWTKHRRPTANEEDEPKDEPRDEPREEKKR